MRFEGSSPERPQPMNDVIEIDGKSYHSDYEGTPLLDEDGEPVPSDICICAAHSAYECSCGAWDRPIPGFEEEDEADYP